MDESSSWWLGGSSLSAEMALLTTLSDFHSQLVPNTAHICKDGNFKKDKMHFLVGFIF